MEICEFFNNMRQGGHGGGEMDHCFEFGGLPFELGLVAAGRCFPGRKARSEGGDFEVEQEEVGGGDGEAGGGELNKENDALVDLQGPAEVPGGAVAAHGLVEGSHGEGEEERGKETARDSGGEGKGSVLQMFAGQAPGIEGAEEGGGGECDKDERGQGTAEEDAIESGFHGVTGKEGSSGFGLGGL